MQEMTYYSAEVPSKNRFDASFLELQVDFGLMASQPTRNDNKHSLWLIFAEVPSKNAFVASFL